MSYPTFEQLMTWQKAAAVREAHPFALIENRLRAAVPDLDLVASIMSDVTSLISDREDEARSDGDEEGYSRGREDFDCGPFGHS